MQPVTLYAAAVALVGALAALGIYHMAVVRPALARMQRLVQLHDELIGGGASVADRLGTIEENQRTAGGAAERISSRLTELEALAADDISRAGFVRYDAFADSESGLSYALALLNRRGDGVVLTSIYSRADTRTFGKPVESFKPTVQASAEELEAIERARSAKS